MPGINQTYSIRSKTVRINAASAQEAVLLAIEKGGDLDFQGNEKERAGEKAMDEAARGQQRLLQDVPRTHHPGGYLVNLYRWALLNDRGLEIDAEYLAGEVGGRQPHFTNPDATSRSDAYLSGEAEIRMHREIPEPDNTKGRSPSSKSRL